MSQEPDMPQDGQQGELSRQAFASVTVVCRGCGRRFTPRRRNQTHCKPSCRVRDWEHQHNPTLPWDDRHKLTRCEAVAAVFTARPGQWIDGRYLASVGGYGGWRTRISNLRHAPWFMQITARVRREAGYTISEYRYL